MQNILQFTLGKMDAKASAGLHQLLKTTFSLTCHRCCPREITLLPLPAQASEGGEKMMGFCWLFAFRHGCVPSAC